MMKLMPLFLLVGGGIAYWKGYKIPAVGMMGLGAYLWYRARVADAKMSNSSVAEIAPGSLPDYSEPILGQVDFGDITIKYPDGQTVIVPQDGSQPIAQNRL